MIEDCKQEILRVQIYSTPNEMKYSLRKGICVTEKDLQESSTKLRSKYSKFLKPVEAENLEEYEFNEGTKIQTYPISIISKEKPWPQARILDIQTSKTPQELIKFLKKNLGLEVTLNNLV